VGSIDLNADVGERFASWRPGDDESIIAVITTAHIACGFHSGDPTTMDETVRLAVRHGVAIGAHPSYLDRDGFGRRPMEVGSEQIRLGVIYQVAALDGIARAAGTRVRSVKPHGALYNRMGVDAECASAVARAVQDLGDDLWLVAPAGSVGAEVARSVGIRVAEEAFCDRGYAADGTLVPRSMHGAVVTDPTEASQRALRLVRDHRVDTTDGEALELTPSTVCVHGDTPGAAAIASGVRAALEAAGYAVRPFSFE